MNTTKSNTLSFYNEQGILTLIAKQFDTGRRFAFHIVDNDKPFDLSDCNAYLRIAKADGTQFQGHECCTIDGSAIIIDTSVGNGSQILTAAGTNICELHLENTDGISLTTWTFNILVEPRVHDGSHITSVDSFDVLDIAERNEEIRQRNEAVRQNQETQRQGNETSRQENEENRKSKFEQFENRIAEITDEAKSYATNAKSWTVGGTNTRTGEDTDNSKHYYEQTKSIAESFSGTLRPKGTVAFAALPTISSAKEGDMYNISNQFTTTADFKEGSGRIIPAGANIYKTADGKWDVLAGTPVTGIKGNNENTYRQGNVNITAANVGALPATGGNIHGNLTIYADGSSPNPDLKVRDGRVDILKTDGGDSVAVFDKSRVRIGSDEFKIIEETSGNTGLLVERRGNTQTGYTQITVGDRNVKYTDIKSKNVTIQSENVVIGDAATSTANIDLRDTAEVKAGETLAFSTDDAFGNRAVVIHDTDKIHIGTTDTAEHTYDMLINKNDTGAHVSTGMRIEENGNKFTFYQEAAGIQFDLEDLVNNRWFNTSNGTYKFVTSGDGWFMSNNQGVHNSDADSTWEGIFKQNTDITITYKVSSETNYDKLTIYVDGKKIVDGISGNIGATTVSTRVKSGKHTLRAVYHKDSSNNTNDDTAYLKFDNVMVSLPEIQIPKYFGTCSTAADTAAKTVSCPGFQLVTGAEITVKFTNGNSAANPTLNVNGTNAKSIYYRNAAITAYQIQADGIYTFRYDGTCFRLVGELGTSGLTQDDADELYTKKSLYGDTTVNVGRKADSDIGDSSFAFGKNVTATGTQCVALGGEENSVFLRDNSAIIGGYKNIINDMPDNAGDDINFRCSVILGGHNNQITAGKSVILGGSNNSVVQTNGAIIASNNCTSTGGTSCVIGSYYSSTNSTQSCVIGGFDNHTNNNYAVAEGYKTNANGYGAHSEGAGTIALQYQHVMGHYNDTSKATESYVSGTSDGTIFCIGNGTEATRSNAARIDGNGKLWCKKSYSSTGADYAELFEWEDGNPDNKDRRGYFVTMNGDKIKIASPDDNYILGIVSANPAVLGNTDMEWQGQFMKDEFGDFIKEKHMETMEEPCEDESGNIKIIEKENEVEFYKVNPEYDPDVPYIDRIHRPEWDPVGMLGVLAVHDDGTCEVNGFCKVSEGGIATSSDVGYRVIKRVSDNIVKVIFK